MGASRINAPPFSIALIKTNTARVKKNIVGISTSIKGTCVKRYGMPIKNKPA